MMKKIISITMFLWGVVPYMVWAQQVPTNNNPVNGGQHNGNYWSRSGNSGAGGKQNNIFGTKWNSPIYFITGGLTQATYRMRLNGTFINPTQYPINGYDWAAGVNTSGYLGLGYNMSGIWSHNTGSARGPFSLLHLNGRDGTFVQDGGYRPWMKTGITFTDNNDLSYIGMRKVGNSTDKTETTITWSDNSGNAFPGPDDMVFRFTAGGNGNTMTSSNLTDPSDLDGLHVARFTGEGLMGLGPTFGDPTLYAFYVRPQSLLHMSRDKRKQTWLQITNQNGTGQTANDGLRIGIRGGNNASAYLRWQENTPFIIQTDWNTTPGGINNGERMRITTVNAPGVPNPAAPFSQNTTRVAISHLGSAPVTKPRSLLHLGYNTGKLSFGGPDGWRKWMDIGMFISNGTDNGYFGLKEEKGQNNDRFDMVINWGDNQVAGNSVNGPDNLRFIFTSTTTALPPGQGDPVSQSYDGLEIARMAPGKASTMPTDNFGMVGIGNFAPGSANAPGSASYIDAKLDIDGDLRIRTVTEDSLSEFVLVIDTSDYNRVHYRKLSTLGGNGWGNFCSAPQNPITNDWEIPLNNYSYNFTATQYKGRVNVGDLISCGMLKPARLYSRLTQIMDSTAKEHSAIIGQTNGTNFIPFTTQYGVWGIVYKANSFESAGVYGQSLSPKNIIGSVTRGIGVKGTASNATQNIGVYGFAQDNNAVYNVGGYFEANYGTNNIGVYASATPTSGTTPPTGPNYAGYFNGDVYISGSYGPSDQNMKTNITNYDSSLYVLMQLQPRTFEFTNVNYPGMNLPTGHQYGLIAQEVESVLPSVVSNHIYPAEYDSLGNQIHPSYTFKGLDYEAFIPILIGGIKEQQTQMDSMRQALEQKDSLLNEVFARLSALENCVDNANLCNMDARTGNPAAGNDFETSVELNNLPGIILDQNVPNPFVENTVITFTIPEEVSEASLIFYDTNGRIIKTTLIHERGNGKMVVYGENLSTGIYTYALVADGKVIATKQMVKTE